MQAITVRLLLAGVYVDFGLFIAIPFSKIPFQILWHSLYGTSFSLCTSSVKICNGNIGNQGKNDDSITASSLYVT